MDRSSITEKLNGRNITLRDAAEGGGIKAERRVGGNPDGTTAVLLFPDSSALQACQPQGTCMAFTLTGQFPLSAGENDTVEPGHPSMKDLLEH